MYRRPLNLPERCICILLKELHKDWSFTSFLAGSELLNHCC
jgi:hypothetical protein